MTFFTLAVVVGGLVALGLGVWGFSFLQKNR